MEDDWKSRLKERIDTSGYSLRTLSAKAGHGVNFVQQLLKDDKDPGFGKLAALLSELGPDATVYVTSGVVLGTDQQLEATLKARGITGNDLATVMGIINKFTPPPNVAKPKQTQSGDQSQPANLPHDAKP